MSSVIPQWVKNAPRQTGKLAILTGASAGLGYQTALFLAERGATVVLATRSEQKTKETIIKMLSDCADIKREQLVHIKLDLGLRSSIRKFVDDFNASGLVAKHGGLHILVNNAGGWYPKSTTADGLDYTLAANSLGPFLLTNLLLRTALAPPNTPTSVPVRIVNVSSELHKYSRSSNIQSMKPSDDVGYPWSKAYNISFARHLAKRLGDDGRTNITAYSLHPGVVRSEFQRDMFVLLRKVVQFFAVSPSDGAKTQFHLAVAPGVEKDNGQFFQNCAVHKVLGWAANESVDEAVWAASVRWTQLDD
ncbi:NAD(P)-binding protein [Ramicandelaber brevisporus]|nr:NAD(P)-binding protein [Ramicandelaber brevisporus]